MTAKKRGRPPTGKAVPVAERVKRYRKRKLEAGGERLDILLDPDAVTALMACIGAHGGLTVSELVGQLLKREAERVRK